MKLLKSLSKPEYVYNPSQVYRRILFEYASDKSSRIIATLPWGLSIEFNPKETIGSCIGRQGLYELTVSETLWRLCDTGEIAVDVGSNIGHMTSLMAVRVGDVGKVFCFEPHPEIFSHLQSNLCRWESELHLGEIVAINSSLSNVEGVANLYIPKDFRENEGIASLENNTTDVNSYEYCHEVEVTKLDKYFSGKEIGVLKIDVEGHELSVLQGGDELLGNGKIRDIIFEEHKVVPTPVTVLLQDYGFDIYFVEKRMSGLKLRSIGEVFDIPKGEPPTYLATIDPERAHKRLALRGYQVFNLV